MNPSRRQLTCMVFLGLALLTSACYGPMLGHEFINIDDRQYITGNPQVTSGLTWNNILWAFRSGYAANWHPLTWISHMADCQLYGLSAGGHHLTNLLLHSLNTGLVFLALASATRRLWPAALVAALFGWHPLHVESVAWAAERKDVLSTFFWLLTLLTYLKYVRAEGAGEVRQGRSAKSRFRSRTLWYSLTLFFFACGLMSKPMVVTLPFVLLLLDFWPIGRCRISNLTETFSNNIHLVVEKLPFFALTVISSIITFVVQDRGGATASLQNISLPLRLENSLIAYSGYVGKALWPAKLTVLYPYVDNPLLSQLLAGLMLLIGTTVLCLIFARRYPFLAVGWLWFIGTLVPVIGLVQVGSQAMADRYMYIPSIGIFMAIVWGGVTWWERSGGNKLVLGAVGVAILVLCAGLTSVQLRYWKNSLLLARHGVEVLPNNYLAYDALTKALDDSGRFDEALAASRKSVELEPNFPEGQYNLAALLGREGKYAEAAFHYEIALKRDPKCDNAAHGLGNSYFKLGRLDDAIVQLVEAVRLKPKSAEVHSDLGTVFLAQHQPELAIPEFDEAVRLNPGQVEAQRNLGVALAGRGRIAAALPHLERAVELAPTNADIRFNYCLALLDAGTYERATNELIAGLRLFPEEPRFHYRLAIAETKLHRPEQAIKEYREALRLYPDFPEAQKELSNLLAICSETSPAAGSTTVPPAQKN
jgi:tetratricopeptide (TPR) repeat protein